MPRPPASASDLDASLDLPAGAGGWQTLRNRRDSFVMQEHINSHKLSVEEREKMESFEGLDYDIVENEAYVEEMHRMTKKGKRKLELSKWGVTTLIGFCTGFTAFLLRVGCESLAQLRFRATLRLIGEGDHSSAFVVFSLFAVFYVSGGVPAACVCVLLLPQLQLCECGSLCCSLTWYLLFAAPPGADCRDLGCLHRARRVWLRYPRDERLPQRCQLRPRSSPQNIGSQGCRGHVFCLRRPPHWQRGPNGPHRLLLRCELVPPPQGPQLSRQGGAQIFPN